MFLARFVSRCRAEVSVLFVAGMLLTTWGCDVSSPPANAPSGGSATSDAGGSSRPRAKNDLFTAAAADAEPNEKPFLEPARPFLTALEKRDYAAAYGELSSHARAKTMPWQFVPPENPDKPLTDQPLEDLTQEQFIEWMQKMEARLGKPKKLQHLYVQSADPKVLSGKGEPLDVMFAIGGMPKEIPPEIRKASLRTQVACHLSDEAVKQIATDLKIPEEQVRGGKWPENEFGYDPEEPPYLNLKFVLVEEEGKLKVGYFEFMPPSILD